MLPQTNKSGQGGFVPRPGGAALNAAIALARQGAEVGLLTGMSRDQFGQLLDAALSEAGVDRSLIIRSNHPTALAFVHLNGQEASYSFQDEGSAGRMLTASDLPPLPDRVRCLLLGGISLCHRPGADAYSLLARRAQERLLVLDPNIRPGCIADERDYRGRIHKMLGRAHIVKLSEADLDWIDPRQISLRDKLDGILSGGPSLVLYTRGAKGVVALHQSGHEVKVPARRVKVADTIGAGDAFNAGFLARLAAMDHLNPAAIEGIHPVALRDCLENGASVAAKALASSAGI